MLVMVPLAVTSTSGMIRRLGGKRWQMLHRLVYVSSGFVPAGARQAKTDFRRVNGCGNKVVSTLVMRLSGCALTARTHHRGKPHGLMRFAV